MLIDTKTILKYRISANQLLLIELVINQDSDFVLQYSEIQGFTVSEINDLIKRQYLSFIDGEEYLLKNLTLGEKCSIFVESSDFFDQWWLLWPSSIKSGGYYIKGDKSGCKSKLLKFKSKRPQFPDEIILKATKSYIDRMKSNGYYGIQLASNFIEKNGISVLASECENVDNKRVDFMQDG